CSALIHGIQHSHKSVCVRLTEDAILALCMREASTPLPPTALSKFARLAELLSQASLVAAEISRNYGDIHLTIPELKRPKRVPKDQDWFWSKEWQAGEREVNEA